MTCSNFNLEAQILATYETIIQDKSKMAETLKLMIIEGAYITPFNSILAIVNGVIQKVKATKGINPFKLLELLRVYRNMLSFYPKTSYRIIPELSINTDLTLTQLIEINTPTGIKPLVSKNLSSYMSSQLFRIITGVSVIDLTSERPFWVNAGNLRDSIEQWRENLVQDLISYLRNKGYNYNAFYLKDSINSMSAYLAKVKPIMTKAWECILKDMNTSNNPYVLNGKFDTAIDSKSKRDIISPIMALTILNNFDEIIEHFSNGEININPAFKGSFELYLGKYTFSKKVMSKSSFEGDEFSDVSAERVLSNLLKRVFEIIPDGHGGTGFCTVHDLNAIAKHIFTISSTVQSLNPAVRLESLMSDNPSAPFAVLLADDSSEVERFDALIKVLNSEEFRNRFADPLKLDSIITHLEKANQAFSDSMPTDSLENEAAFHTQRNIINQLVSFIRNTCNLAYGQITKNGFDINTNSGIRKNKVAAQSKLKEALRLNIQMNNLIGLYHPYYTILGMSGPVWTSGDLKNEDYLRYIKTITGIDLQIPILLEYIDGHPELSTYTVNEFIYKFNRIVHTKYNAKEALLTGDDKNWEAFINDVVDTLIGTTEYVAFTDMIAYESGQDQSMIYDLKLNPQPTLGMSPTISKWVLNTRDFLNQLDEIADDAGLDYDDELRKPKNIFLRFPGLRSEHPGKRFDRTIFTDPHIFRSDVLFKLKGYEQIVKSTKLSAGELFVVSLIYEFLDSTLKTGLVVNQIEDVSDKARVPLGVTNGHAEINGKAFNKLSLSELFDLYYELTAWYYQVIEAKIIADYKKLFAAAGWNIPADGTLESFIAELEKHTYADLKKAVRKIFDEGGYFELQGFIHYDPKTESGGNLRFNNALYIQIKASKDANGKKLFKELVNSGVEETITLAKLEEMPLTYAIDKSQAKQLLEFLQVESLGVTEKDVSDYLMHSKNLAYNDSTEAFRIISDALFTRYVYTHNLLAEADLQVSGKFLFLHKSKLAPKSIHELNGMSMDSLIEFFIKDMSDRGKVSRKRMATLTSLSEGVVPNNQYGPGRTTRFAYIAPHVTTLYNPNGDPHHKLPTNDGGIFGNGVYDIIETMGYVGKNYHVNSQKIISIIPTFFNMHFIKCAKYSINNERIRGSFDEPLDNHHYNFHTLFKKMNMAPISARFLAQWAADSMLISNNLVWKRMLDGTLAYFDEESVSVLGNTVTANWKNEEGQIVFTEEAEINTVYDLWLLFGGCDSYSFNEDNKLVPSESSLIMTALMVCKYGGNLKEELISKAIDTESAKVGIVNANTVEEVADENTPLLYLIVDTSRTGDLNEYTHSMIDLDIPLLTLALQALALNGKNPELALFVFDEIAAIVEDSLENIDKYFDPETRQLFKAKLVNELQESLLSTNVSSTANDVVRYTKEKIQNWIDNGKIGDMPLLPFSDRNIFSKVTSDQLVKLNSRGIRQRSNGIALILNPSHGIIGVYEDKLGRIYTRENVKGMSPDFNHRTALDTLEDFLDELITHLVTYTVGEAVKEVTINETGEVINERSYIIDDPFKMWVIENEINNPTSTKRFYKLHKAKRDLKTRQVTFTEILESPDGNIMYLARNLWGIRSTKFRLLLDLLSNYNSHADQLEMIRKYLALTDVDITNFLATGEAKSPALTAFAEKFKKVSQAQDLIQKLSSFGKDVLNEFLRFRVTDTASLAYMRANYEGLGAEIPYYYKSFADFKASLTSEDPNAGKTFVVNVITRAGEQIIPNRFKLEFGIEDSLADVLYSVDETGRHNYFDKVLTKRLQKTHTVTVDKKHFGVTLTTNDMEILITDLNIESGVKVVLGESENDYYITDFNGNKLFNVLNGNYHLASYKLDNGKTFYLIQVENDKQAEYLISQIKDVNLYYNENNFKQVLKYNKKQGISFNPSEAASLTEYILTQSNAVYNSFVMTLNTISTRIPSQSWPSFLATVTVAFTDNELNDGYMNIWEMWFLGSDFDIDKAYTMMFTLDHLGRIAGNGFMDYSTSESIIESLEHGLAVQAKGIEFIPAYGAFDVDLLPKKLQKRTAIAHWDPDTNLGSISVSLYGKTVDEISAIVQALPDLQILEDGIEGIINLTPSNIDTILELFPSWLTKRDIYALIINLVKDQSGLISVNTTPGRPVDYRGQFYSYSWMRELNSFNRMNLIPYRLNRIMYKMWKATNSMLNYEAATKPMDSGLVTNPMDEVESDTTTYNEYSPFTKLIMQYNAQMGKDDVGGAANGIKADGGLQHYITYLAILNGLGNVFTPNFNLKFDDNNSTTLVDIDVHKIANVNLSSQDFQYTLNRRYAEQGEVLNNPLIRSLLANSDSNPEFFKPDGKSKLKFYKRVEEAFELWGKGDAQTLTDDQAKEFLEYFATFEDNAADILSVIISLATDNAKELRLAYLNAPLELISIPIALTVYGVDVYSMVQICMKVLTPVLKAMTLNRFSKGYLKRDVSEAVLYCLKAKKLSATNAKSLKTVIRLGNELRFLSQFYKINQGAKTDIIELQRWMSLLAHVKLTLEEDYGVEFKAITSIYNNVVNNWRTLNDIPSGYKGIAESLISRCTLVPIALLTDAHLETFRLAILTGLENGHSKPIDFNRLFGETLDDMAYSLNLLNYFNIFSTGFNLMAAILKSPSYKSQLKAVVRTTSMFNSLICTNALSLELINLNPNTSISDGIIKTLFGNFAIGEFVKTLDNFVFNKQDIEKRFKGVSIPGGLQSSFSLDSNTGVSLFMNTVRNGVIPRLLKEYKENFFVSSLTEKHHYQNGMSYYALPFNAFAAEDLLIERSYIAEAKSQFASIMKQSSGLVNNKGEELTIGEVLYVYNLIATGGSMGATTTCVEAISEYSTIPNKMKDIIESLDRQSEQLEGKISSVGPETNPILNRELVYRLDKIKKALESSSKVYLDSETLLSLNGQWILTNALMTPSWTEALVRQLLIDEFSSDILTSFTIDYVNLTYTATLQYTINGLVIKDSISGTVSVTLDPKKENLYTISSSNMEDIRYKIRGKIQYAENALGIHNKVTSLTTTSDIVSTLHTGSSLDNTLRKLLEPLQNTQVNVIKVTDRINPYSIIFNGLLYLIMPDDVSYDFTDPKTLNALLGLTTNGGSTKSNMAKVLSTILNNNEINSNNLTYWLEKLRKLKEYLKLPQTILDYIDWAITEEVSVEFKEKMQRKLSDYTKVFNNESIRSYYFNSTTENTDLLDGDIFDVFGVKYLYLGMYQSKHVLCSLDGNTNLRISYTSPDSAYTKVMSKRKSVYESLGTIRASLNTYNTEVDAHAKPFESLMLGDLIITNDGTKDLTWIVIDVLLDLDNNLKLLIRLEDGTDNITVDEVGSDMLVEGTYNTKTAIVNETGMGRIEHSFTNSTAGVQFSVPTNFAFNTQHVIYTNSGVTGTFIKKLDNAKILIQTETGRLDINIQDIISISGINGTLDAHLKYLVDPIIFYATNEDASRLLKEFNGNFIQESSNGKIKFIKSNISRNNVLKWVADTDIRLDQFYDVVLDTIAAGAIIETDRGYLKVLDIKNGYLFGILNQRNGTLYYTVVAESELLTGKIYRPKTEKNIYVRPTAQHSLSDFLIGTRVLEVLRLRFNADIEIFSDENNPHFAQIVDGVIKINTAKLDAYNKTLPKEGQISLEKYVALLGLHEFTHLMLALLQANNFALYEQIMSLVKGAVDNSGRNSKLRVLWGLIAASKEYDSELDTKEGFINYKRYEEVLVRAIEATFRNNLDTILGNAEGDLEFALRNSLAAGFGLFINVASRTSLSKNMKASILDFQKDIFGYTTVGSSIDFLRRNTLSTDVLSNIYCV